MRHVHSLVHTRVRSLIAVVSALTLSLALNGCASMPRSTIPTEASFANADSEPYSQAAAVQSFWRSYQDAQLDALIERALQANRDLRAAEARLRQSRALANQSRMDFLPSGTIGAQYLETKVGNAPSVSGYTSSITANWEVDLFGRVRNGVRGRSADAEAALADLHGVRVTVASETARVYFQLRGATSRLAVARASAENQRQSLELTKIRFEEGAGSELDLQRAATQVQTTLATLPQIETQQRQLLYQLAVLLGESPSRIQSMEGGDSLLQVQSIRLPELVPVGDPATWLRRRPDIRRAEARMASAAAAAGVSVATLFPKVALTGNALGGTTGVVSDFSDLTHSASQIVQWGPGITWTILNLPKLLFDVSAQRARRDESLANYEQTVLNALAETESALVTYRNARQREAELDAANTASQRAEELSRVRFDAGAADFLSVLDAQRTQLQVADQLAQSHTDRATALISVYKALGVGWDASEAGKQLVK